jgi:hypothetical protein
MGHFQEFVANQTLCISGRAWKKAIHLENKWPLKLFGKRMPLGWHYQS